MIRARGLALLLVAACAAPKPAAPPPEPAPVPAVGPHAAAVREVRPVSAAAIDTRRLSYLFEFVDVATNGHIYFRTFQGADVENGKDAASRLIELLDATPGERKSETIWERPFVLASTGTLRFSILSRPLPERDSWIFERPDGRRASVTPGRNRP